VQLAGVPLPITRVGFEVSTARASAGMAACPFGLPVFSGGAVAFTAAALARAAIALAASDNPESARPPAGSPPGGPAAGGPASDPHAEAAVTSTRAHHHTRHAASEHGSDASTSLALLA
jgi:hypothetical protein